jgi:hypothetical protein
MEHSKTWQILQACSIQIFFSLGCFSPWVRGHFLSLSEGPLMPLLSHFSSIFPPVGRWTVSNLSGLYSKSALVLREFLITQNTTQRSYLFVFLVVLGFELMASHLLGKCSIIQPFFALVIFQIGSHIFAQGRPQTDTLLSTPPEYLWLHLWTSEQGYVVFLLLCFISSCHIFPSWGNVPRAYFLGHGVRDEGIGNMKIFDHMYTTLTSSSPCEVSVCVIFLKLAVRGRGIDGNFSNEKLVD